MNIKCPRCDKLINRLIPLKTSGKAVNRVRAEPCGHILHKKGDVLTDVSLIPHKQENKK